MEFFVSDHAIEGGDGKESTPFKDIDQVFRLLETTSEQKIDYKIYCKCAEGWKEVSKAQIKKLKKNFLKSSTKTIKTTVNNIEEAFDQISLDPALPQATQCHIKYLKPYTNKRVVVKGHIQQIRKQSKKLWFIKLRDGTGYLQCVLENKLCNTREATQLLCECSVIMYGKLRELPVDNKTTGGMELDVDYWELVGDVKQGGIECTVNADSDPDVQFNNRHLMIRGENTTKVIKMREAVLEAFIKYFKENDFYQEYPPTLVQTQCEGGSTLFKFDYFGEEAYLSQSSQLYLETLVPVLGKAFAITRSYRAEKSRTRRHLSEYTHIEAESQFITFEDLLNQIEDMMVYVSHRILETHGEMLLQINPTYKPLEKPFVRMEYKDAIKYLEDNNIEKPEGGKYEFGDDIPEAAERKMTDLIQKPILLMRFPAEIKAFYMSRCEDDSRVTESVDVLIPGVGEVVGGSMRIWKKEELFAAFEREKIDPKSYYWYTDMREFGTTPHGGFGLGFERFLTWLLNKEHIKDVCLYPRYTGRCAP